ncbi:aminotransferase class V-fold PLP-dependent enzyme [uncultured Shewanella sp.]|uniref:aminotransferase class V-fold PLP-dependent enzyme n=1 Tax=uncultured Shewanella sp. TaxID=173975 RepID=UPI00262EB52C|nr:aminotransferase class V-fold PLP-dependent enzyme [uncultured Shewanella sp.]
MFTFKRTAYLDNNATTPLSSDVINVMDQVLKKHFGNPSSLHQLGYNAANLITSARKHIASAINSQQENIFFTSTASEANNQVLHSLVEAFDIQSQKLKIISSPIEHMSIIATLSALKNKGVIVEYLKVNTNGQVDIKAAEAQIDDNTGLVCCMLANNEIGSIQHIEVLAKIAKKHNALILSDCVQALGKIPINVEELNLDYATFSAHKVHGPKGIGAIYVKSGAPFHSLIKGGGQESGLRAGTESTHNIVGFGQACLAIPHLLKKASMTLQLKMSLKEKLISMNKGITFNAEHQNTLNNTLSITIPNVDKQSLIAFLDHHNICISTDSACCSHTTSASHVLIAIGLNEKKINETIRVSLSTQTTEKEIEYFITKLQHFFDTCAQKNITLISPQNLDDAFLRTKDHYLLDIRSQFERLLMKSMPNSHECHVFNAQPIIRTFDKNDKLILVCSSGMKAMIFAYQLSRAGFQHIHVLAGGLLAWRKAHKQTHQKMNK